MQDHMTVPKVKRCVRGACVPVADQMYEFTKRERALCGGTFLLSIRHEPDQMGLSFAGTSIALPLLHTGLLMLREFEGINSIRIAETYRFASLADVVSGAGQIK